MRVFSIALLSSAFSSLGRLGGWSLIVTGSIVAGCAQNPVPARGVSGAAFKEIVIAEKFHVRPLTVEDYPAEAARCLGIVTTAAQAQRRLAEFGGLPIKDGRHLVVRNPGRPRTLVIFRSSSVCLEESDAGYPILPTEVLSETVEPVGVPEDVKQDWYQQILRKLAEKGTARVLYLHSNGNAEAAVYWVKRNEADTLNYGSDFKRAGQFKPEDYDLLFNHAGLSAIRTTRIEFEGGAQSYSRSFYKTYIGRPSNPGVQSAPRRATPTPR